jgi:hypothetical protein
MWIVRGFKAGLGTRSIQPLGSPSPILGSLPSRGTAVQGPWALVASPQVCQSRARGVFLAAGSNNDISEGCQVDRARVEKERGLQRPKTASENTPDRRGDPWGTRPRSLCHVCCLTVAVKKSKVIEKTGRTGALVPKVLRHVPQYFYREKRCQASHCKKAQWRHLALRFRILGREPSVRPLLNHGRKRSANQGRDFL